MAKSKAIEVAGSESVASPDSASEQAQPKVELPAIESPSISPAKIETMTEPPDAAAAANEIPLAAVGTEETAAVIPEIDAPKRPRFILRPRHKRYAVLAASVAIAAAFGAVVGAATTGGFSRPAAVDVSAEENKATQQSVDRLAKEVTSLKASFDTANKLAHSQIAKISGRLSRENAEVTGSITPPQTVPSAPQTSAPMPASRPAPAAAELQAARLPIVADWWIRETRDGYVYVQGHGDIYQVVPGAPLPGIGPVERIKRQDGRWVVVTPKGIIVSMRDRRYFEQF